MGGPAATAKPRQRLTDTLAKATCSLDRRRISLAKRHAEHNDTPGARFPAGWMRLFFSWMVQVRLNALLRHHGWASHQP